MLASCSNNESGAQKNDRVDNLTNGKWMVSEFDGEKNKFSQGIVFSKDKQFFLLDSQGRIVPKNREIIFELKSDTLRVVDYNYEPQFILKKGTKVFIVKELDEKELFLRSVYPDSTSSYKFRKEEL
jgi:hypothetical protein